MAIAPQTIFECHSLRTNPKTGELLRGNKYAKNMFETEMSRTYRSFLNRGGKKWKENKKKQEKTII